MLLNSSSIDSTNGMEVVRSGEERTSLCVELDIHTLPAGWVCEDTVKLKVKVLPPPTITIISPDLGRGIWSQVYNSHTSPVVKKLEAGGWTVPWQLCPLPRAGQMCSGWTTLSEETA